MLYMSQFSIFYFKCSIFSSKTCDILFEFELLTLKVKYRKLTFEQAQINFSSTILIMGVFTLKPLNKPYFWK